MNARMICGDAMFFMEVNKMREVEQEREQGVVKTAVAAPAVIDRLVAALRRINFAPLRPESIRQTPVRVK
ncbi:MAG: hypothetical protein KC419_11465 [Anaerolineales bacterium]|nr:hypothetical protein [Anaerolineales bacterium]MCA9929093.1 hypothetical protein [Anaerolineales bacterium]